MAKEKVRLFLCNLKGTIEKTKDGFDIYFKKVKQEDISDCVREGNEVVIRTR
jgi:hypothetical protein